MRDFTPYRKAPSEARGVQCGFCRSKNMNTANMTCKDCGTTAANTRFRDRRKKEKNAVSS